VARSAVAEVIIGREDETHAPSESSSAMIVVAALRMKDMDRTAARMFRQSPAGFFSKVLPGSRH
jgi:hypothetical protein